MFQVIGACFDGSAKYYGSRLGPQAVRFAGMKHIFQESNIPFIDLGDVSIPSQTILNEPLQGLTWGTQFYPLLTQKVKNVLHNNSCPLIIGGDQSIRLATITAALNQYNPNEIGVIWIDPYIQFETINTSHSVHEMVLTTLIQTKNEKKFSFLSNKQLNLDNIAFLASHPLIEEQSPNLFIQSTDLIFQDKIAIFIERLSYWIKKQKIKKLWVSFNIQSLNKFSIPSSEAHSGLTITQAFSLAKSLNFLCLTKNLELIGVEALELNPILDPLNQSSSITLEWLTYLLGNLKQESLSKKRELTRTA